MIDSYDVLYIIGNGFDLHNGMKTSYANFQDYLGTRNIELSKILSRYIASDADWGKLEADLANVKFDIFLKDFGIKLKLEKRDWQNIAAIYCKAEEFVEPLTKINKELQKEIRQWILSQSYPFVGKEDIVFNTDTSMFLTFNYTDTLEHVYHIPKERVFHIHGKANDSNSKIEFGFGWVEQNKINAEQLLEFEKSSVDVQKADEEMHLGVFETMSDALNEKISRNEKRVLRIAHDAEWF